MVDSTVDSGTWLTLAEAARALGVSEKTTRRRVKAGQLKGRQVATRHGQTWQAWVPMAPPRVDTSARVDSEGTQSATTLELVRMVGELQAKAETAAMWQARAELLAERLHVAEDRILALAAPSERPQEGQEPLEAPEPTPTATAPVLALLRRYWPLIVAVAVLLAVAGAWLLVPR